ncbi:hypothetical protein K492DRAFT_170771 [Lichtheimia hyalospora FSU 10163]|nr:hypothetical protein K492DRAFT_170771 [Lichtheimia hyalospora FSU 10163]
MEKGLEALRQELDDDGSYDRLLKIYQPIHITQSTRGERRLRTNLSSSKSALRNVSSEAPSTTRATTLFVEMQPSTRSISSTPVVTKNTVAVSSSSSNMSDPTTCNDQRSTLSTPSRSNRRRLNIANDNTLPLRLQPRVVSASSSSSSLSHQSPSLSQRSNHNSPSSAIQRDSPSSSTSTSLQQSNTQQQSDNMINPEVTSKDLMQLIRETNKGIRQIMKANRKIKKRRSVVEKSLLALSRAREMEIQANLISRMIESGFSKEEISQVINK